MATRRSLSQAQWDAVRDEIHCILIEVAKAGRTITYAELAAQLRTVYLHHRAPVFAALLRDVCAQAERAGHGRLCALVVTKQTGMPGQGFFKAAVQSGLIISDPVAYWQNEVQNVYARWGTQTDTTS